MLCQKYNICTIVIFCTLCMCMCMYYVCLYLCIMYILYMYDNTFLWICYTLIIQLTLYFLFELYSIHSEWSVAWLFSVVSRYLAAGSSNAVKLSKFFDKVIENKLTSSVSSPVIQSRDVFLTSQERKRNYSPSRMFASKSSHTD